MKKFLLGNIRLVIMFWLFFVVGELFFEYLIHVFKNNGIEENLRAIICILIFSIIYDAIIIVATWNSANKYQGKQIWKYLTKIVVGIKTILLLATIIWLIIILIKYPDFVDLIISKFS